jgi:hypothetical protein
MTKTLCLLPAAALLSVFTVTATSAEVAPPPPKFADALKLKGSQALIFTPTRMGKDCRLDASFLRLAKPVVRPNEKQYLQLVVYALRPNPTGDGTHDILFSNTVQITDGTSRITDGTSNTILFGEFTPSQHQAVLPYIEQDNRVGIIAILIGLRQVGPGPHQPMNLPGADTISVEVNPPDGGLGLLLPAVQKVRAAAARL